MGEGGFVVEVAKILGSSGGIASLSGEMEARGSRGTEFEECVPWAKDVGGVLDGGHPRTWRSETSVPACRDTFKGSETWRGEKGF